jgi:hypothetical protein
MNWKFRLAVLATVLLTIGPLAIASGDDAYVLPAGTTINVKMTTTVSSKVSQMGDPFSGEVLEPIFANHREVVPDGSTVDGHVAMVQPPGHHAKAEMRLAIDSITTPDGLVYKLTAGLQGLSGAQDATLKGNEGTIEGAGKGNKGTAKEAGRDAAMGAGVGALADGGMGAVYGAGIGAAVALIHHLHKTNKDITLTQGTELTFTVPRDAKAIRVAKSADSSDQ